MREVEPPFDLELEGAAMIKLGRMAMRKNPNWDEDYRARIDNGSQCVLKNLYIFSL